MKIYSYRKLISLATQKIVPEKNSHDTSNLDHMQQTEPNQEKFWVEQQNIY